MAHRGKTSFSSDLELLDKELEERIRFFERYEGETEDTPVPRMTKAQFMPALAYGVFLVLLWIITAITLVPR